MRQVTADVWSWHRRGHWVVVPTNGTVKMNGACVMGRVLLGSHGDGGQRMKTEGPKTLGSYCYLGITPIADPTADTPCPVCGDTAGKRRFRNPCACEVHRAYLRGQV